MSTVREIRDKILSTPNVNDTEHWSLHTIYDTSVHTTFNYTLLQKHLTTLARDERVLHDVADVHFFFLHLCLDR